MNEYIYYIGLYNIWYTADRMDKLLNRWMNERMNEYVNEWMNEYIYIDLYYLIYSSMNLRDWLTGVVNNIQVKYNIKEIIFFFWKIKLQF